MSVLVLTYVVSLTVTSLHVGGELRYELQQWNTGNLTVDTQNCEQVRKRLVEPAAKLGRIVLCEIYQQAVSKAPTQGRSAATRHASFQKSKKTRREPEKKNERGR